MTRLDWAKSADDIYEAGVDRGVFYPNDGFGVVWNGLLWVAEKPVGAAITPYFIDGAKYLNEQTPEAFTATIAAYMYPEELEDAEGSIFGLCYRTMIGSGKHYKLHIVYNMLAAPSAADHISLNSSVEAMQFSWDATTVPVVIFDHRPSAHLIIDTRTAYSWVVSALEDMLYGSDKLEPYLPDIDVVLALFEEGSILKITDNGDGTWTADGPDEVVYMTDATTFEIDWPSVVPIDAISYTVRSL